jgi:hypothetical protein
MQSGNGLIEMDNPMQRNGKLVEKQGRKVTELKGTGNRTTTQTPCWLDHLLLSGKLRSSHII